MDGSKLPTKPILFCTSVSLTETAAYNRVDPIFGRAANLQNQMRCSSSHRKEGQAVVPHSALQPLLQVEKVVPCRYSSQLYGKSQGSGVQDDVQHPLLLADVQHSRDLVLVLLEEGYHCPHDHFSVLWPHAPQNHRGVGVGSHKADGQSFANLSLQDSPFYPQRRHANKEHLNNAKEANVRLSKELPISQNPTTHNNPIRGCPLDIAPNDGLRLTLRCWL